MKERILIIATNDLGKSGVPTVFMQIVRNLSEQFVFDVLITRKNNYYEKEFLSYGGKIFDYSFLNIKNRLLRKFFNIFIKNIIVNFKFGKILKKNKYRAIHSFMDVEGGIYLKVASKYGIKKRISNCSRVCNEPKSAIKKLIFNANMRKIYKFSTDLIAVSSKAGKSLFKNHNFQVIYTSYDENYYCKTIYEGTKLNILQVGTILPIKNQLFSLEVLKNIINGGNDAHLYLIGKIYDVNYQKLLIDYIEKNNLKKYVTFYGETFDQNSLLTKITCTILPSLSEGLPLTCVESQASGIKCFASNFVPSEVDAGGTIFLELNAKIWSEKLIYFYKSGMYRFSFNMEKFSSKNFINKIKKIYLN